MGILECINRSLILPYCNLYYVVARLLTAIFIRHEVLFSATYFFDAPVPTSYWLFHNLDTPLLLLGRLPLNPGSQAFDAGNSGACPETDQLGFLRIGTCGIGAVEFQEKLPVLVDVRPRSDANKIMVAVFAHGRDSARDKQLEPGHKKERRTPKLLSRRHDEFVCQLLQLCVSA